MGLNRGYQSTERQAVQIVRNEEAKKGWTPGPPLSKAQEAREGCDFFSTPPDGSRPHPVEVKGWGEPLMGPDGSLGIPADVNVEQLRRAQRDPTWRLEIVANLSAVRAGTGTPERLSLSAADVVERAVPWRYRVPLDGLKPNGF